MVSPRGAQQVRMPDLGSPRVPQRAVVSRHDAAAALGPRRTPMAEGAAVPGEERCVAPRGHLSASVELPPGRARRAGDDVGPRRPCRAASGFGFPEWCGHNWDAFDDCFGDYVEEHDGANVAVIWRHLDAAAPRTRNHRRGRLGSARVRVRCHAIARFRDRVGGSGRLRDRPGDGLLQPWLTIRNAAGPGAGAQSRIRRTVGRVTLTDPQSPLSDQCPSPTSWKRSM